MCQGTPNLKDEIHLLRDFTFPQLAACCAAAWCSPVAYSYVTVNAILIFTEIRRTRRYKFCCYTTLVHLVYIFSGCCCFCCLLPLFTVVHVSTEVVFPFGK